MVLDMKQILCQPRTALLFFAGLSAAALAAAYTAQYGFHLAPCILCLYQRVPFAVIVALGLAGYALNKGYKFFLGLISLSFFINVVIAAYHTGVERKWWRSFLEGCSTPDLSGSIEDLMARIEAAPVTACDAIAWVDPVLGLSMANYNVVVCLAAGIGALVAMRRAA